MKKQKGILYICKWYYGSCEYVHMKILMYVASLSLPAHCMLCYSTHINVWLDKFSPPNLSPIYTRQFYILYIYVHISSNIIFSKSSCTFFLFFFFVFARLLLFLLYYLIFLLLVQATERPTTQFNHPLLLIVIIIVMDRQYSQCTYITYKNEKKHRNMNERKDMWRA